MTSNTFMHIPLYYGEIIKVLNFSVQGESHASHLIFKKLLKGYGLVFQKLGIDRSVHLPTEWDHSRELLNIDNDLIGRVCT